MDYRNYLGDNSSQMKSSTFNQVFRTPFRVAVLATSMSLLLSGAFTLIFFGSNLRDFLLAMLMILIIAWAVSYLSARGIIALRLTIEDHKVKLALEHKRADILAKFIRDAAHEFKTPLALMETSVYLSRRSLDLQKKEKYGQQTSEQIQILNRLLDSILVLTRLDSIDKADYKRDLILAKELVADIKPTYESERVTLHPTDMDSLPYIQANILDIHLAIKQIVGNGLRFSPAPSPVTVTLTKSGEWLLLQIADGGEGMSAETLQHIFDRFYRIDESHTTRGLGLGLAIAKRVVELHEGRIEVQSEIGKGTTVRIYLRSLDPA